jgi:hypothetical protein
MREIAKLPIFRANKRRIPISLGFYLCIVLLSASGCGIGKDIKIKVPPNIQNAKTASYDELLNLIESYKKINEISSKPNSLKLTLVYSKMEGNTRKKLPTVSGYFLLKRPGSIRLVLTKSLIGTVLDMLSVGDELSVWRPDKNTFYTGKNSAKELVSDELPEGFAMRGSHLFEALFPQSIEMDSHGTRISKEDAADDNSKYYIISVYQDDGLRRIRAIRKIWIERSRLAIVRQQFFLEDGGVDSDIEYSDFEQIDGFTLPLKIHMDRPLDGYAVTLEHKSKSRRINNVLPDNAFIMPPPEGAKIVHLREKIRGGAF